MANTNTDLTEEDAADLQFPKESAGFKHTASGKTAVLGRCSNCFGELILKYIFCDRCQLDLCLNCFAKGSEFGGHKNDHEYRIFTSDIPLFANTDWTAEEELKLLDSLLFYDNWALVASDFPSRTLNEVREHYEHFYLDGKGNRNMPTYFPKNLPVEIPVPYNIDMTVHSDDPPRYVSNTVGYQSLAGYNPARGDFENEYDKNAEDLVAGLETVEPQNELINDLQCAIARSYNNRLKERARRKSVIAHHGLLVLRKTMAWLHRYDRTITKGVYDKLVRFMQLCRPEKFVMLVEGLHRAGELKMRIERLTMLRRKGITTLAEARLYLKLQEMHEEHKKQLKIFRNNKTMELPSKGQKRRPFFTPLDIIGMPGYDKLNEKEKEMCSAARLVPLTYLELKAALIAENNRAGRVKLQRARSLLKIDVNKTRKLYDFLVAESYIVP